MSFSFSLPTAIPVKIETQKISVVRPFGEIVAEPYEVRHTASELRELAQSLKSLDGETRVIMEHTGRYYEPIAQKLHDAGIFVSAINPLLIREYGNNSLSTEKHEQEHIFFQARIT